MSQVGRVREVVCA